MCFRTTEPHSSQQLYNNSTNFNKQSTVNLSQTSSRYNSYVTEPCGGMWVIQERLAAARRPAGAACGASGLFTALGKLRQAGRKVSATTSHTKEMLLCVLTEGERETERKVEGGGERERLKEKEL